MPRKQRKKNYYYHRQLVKRNFVRIFKEYFVVAAARHRIEAGYEVEELCK